MTEDELDRMVLLAHEYHVSLETVKELARSNKYAKGHCVLERALDHYVKHLEIIGERKDNTKMATVADKETIVVQGEQETFYGNDGFAKLLLERLGRDACDYFLKVAYGAEGMVRCVGECDYTMQLEENETRFLIDLRDEVEAWDVHKWTKDKTDGAVHDLLRKINHGIDYGCGG